MCQNSELAFLMRWNWLCRRTDLSGLNVKLICDSFRCMEWFFHHLNFTAYLISTYSRYSRVLESLASLVYMI